MCHKSLQKYIKPFLVTLNVHILSHSLSIGIFKGTFKDFSPCFILVTLIATQYHSERSVQVVLYYVSMFYPQLGKIKDKLLLFLFYYYLLNYNHRHCFFLCL